MARRAFTLIELLVVIAIIAILAAILFPVFSQAKAAARATASLSNNKELNLGIIMYSGDADDVAPEDCKWGDKDAALWFAVKGSEFTPWSYVIQPYLKSGEVANDPQTTPEPLHTATDITPSQNAAYYPEYGYNYTALSPITQYSALPWTREPVSFSSIKKPSETVLLASHNTNQEASGWYWWHVGSLLVAPYTVEAPDCYDIVPFCMDNWGSGWYSDVYLKQNRVAGAFTGMVSLRKSGEAIVSFVDGHVRTMSPGQLAAGTNWNPSIQDSDVHMLDSSKYLWGNF